MQLKLEFVEIYDPTRKAWESLDDEQRQAIVERLSRLIVQAALHERNEEEENDDD